MNLWIRRMTYPNSNTKENYLYFLSLLGFELIAVFLTGIGLPCLLVCCVGCALLVLESSRITAAGFQLVKVKWFFLNPLYCIILGFLLSIFCCISVRQNYQIIKPVSRPVTCKCCEFIDQVQVITVGVSGHEVELLLELFVQWIAFVHHSDHEHLNVASLGFCHGALQTDRVPLIGLSVGDDDRHLPHTWPGCLEHLVGLLDGTACECALAQVGHGMHSRLDLIEAGFLSEADHHHVYVAVEDHANTSDVPADRGVVDQGVHKVFDHVEVFRADAL